MVQFFACLYSNVYYQNLFLKWMFLNVSKNTFPKDVFSYQDRNTNEKVYTLN